MLLSKILCILFPSEDSIHKCIFFTNNQHIWDRDWICHNRPKRLTSRLLTCFLQHIFLQLFLLSPYFMLPGSDKCLLCLILLKRNPLNYLIVKYKILVPEHWFCPGIWKKEKYLLEDRLISLRHVVNLLTSMYHVRLHSPTSREKVFLFYFL